LLRWGAASLLALVPPGPAQAQLAQYVINDDRNGEEERVDPRLVRLDGGDLAVLWVDNTRGQRDILVRRFSSELQPMGEPAVVNDDVGYEGQYDLEASAPGGGRFAAVWLDERLPLLSVYAQIFDAADGSPIGSNLELTAGKADGLREAPAAATDADGNSMIVWVEATFSKSRIMGQLVGPGGERLGPAFFAAPETELTQRGPAIAALPDGRWLLAWEEETGGDFQVYHRILEASGTPEEPRRIDHSENVIDPGNGPRPALLVRPEAGDALVIWTDNVQGTSDLWGRWLDLAGNPIGDAEMVRATSDPSRDAITRTSVAADGSFAVTWFGGAVGRELPYIRYFAADRTPLTGDLLMTDQQQGVVARAGNAVPLLDGTWAVAWSDDRSLSQQVYLRRTDGEGTALGASVQGWSVPASSSQFLASTALLPDGRSVVTWADLRNGSLAIFARLLDTGGRPLDQSFQVNTSPVSRRYSGPTGVDTFWPYRPSVATSGLGTFVITWTASEGGGAQRLWGQLFDTTGQTIGDNFPIADGAGEDQAHSDPCPSMAANGWFVVAWHDAFSRQGQEANHQVYFQLFDSTGARVGAPVNPVDSEQAEDRAQFAPSISISPYGDIAMAWVDLRNNRSEIFRQRYSLDLEPLEPRNTRVSDEEPVFNPVIVTNGTSILTVWEDRPNLAGLLRAHLEVLETKRGAPAQTDVIINDFDVRLGVKNPSAAMDSTGRFAVSWWDERDGEQRIWVRRFDPAGAPLGNYYLAPAGDSLSARQHPDVAADTDRLQFVWADARRARGWDVFGRRVDWLYNGEPVPILLSLWEAVPRPAGILVRWQTPADAAGALYRLWRDDGGAPEQARPSARAVLVTEEWLSASDDGLYEALDPTPPPGETVFYFLEMLAGAERDFAGPLPAVWDGPAAAAWNAAPIPFRDRLELRPPTPGAFRASIWDVAGRCVRVLHRAEGDAPLVWDGRDDAGRPAAAGVYFIRAPKRAGGREESVLRVVCVR